MIVIKEYNKQDIADSMSELWVLLTEDQKQYLAENTEFNIYSKNELIYNEIHLLPDQGEGESV